MTDGKSIIIEGSLVDHGLLDHMDHFVSMQNKGVIVAPFLVTLSESNLRSLLSKEESTCIDRICEYQSYLVQANAKREEQQQRTFSCYASGYERYSDDNQCHAIHCSQSNCRPGC